MYAARISVSTSPRAKTAMSITLSSLASFIARTPSDERPANTRISSVAKRITLPLYVESRISSVSSAVLTEIRESPSSSFIAIFPFARMDSKSEILFRRTLPFFVANIRHAPASASAIGRIVVIVSPSESGKRFTIGRPLAAAPPSGSRYVLRR